MRAKILRSVWVGAAAALVGWGIHTYRAEQRVEDARAYSRLAQKLPELRARLHEGVLISRASVITHYDALTQTTLALERLHHILARASDDLDFDEDERHVIDNLAHENAYTTQLVEDIKLHNATLRNSVRHMPVATQTLGEELAGLERGDEVSALLTELLGRILLINLFPDPSLLENLELRKVTELADEVLDDERLGEVKLIVAHARLIVENKPKVDRMVALLVAMPPEITAAVDLFDAHYDAAVQAADERYRILYLLIVALIVAVAADVIVRSRRAASALAYSNNQLEDALRQLRLEQDKTRELAELKIRFMSSTSHEFRTPLAVIMTSAELLEGYGESGQLDKRLEHLDRIMSNAKRMRRLIEAVTFVIRGEAGMVKCNPFPLDLRATCQKAIDTTRAAGWTQHVIVLQVPEDAEVDLDPELLHHILDNLLTNACKYSDPDKAVRLSARIDGDCVVFCVEDKGIGIPEPDQRLLFRDFQRGRNVGQRAGTGLGLVAVKRAVDAHQGTVSFDSKLGAGTRFTVRIPLEIREATEDGEAA